MSSLLNFLLPFALLLVSIGARAQKSTYQVDYSKPAINTNQDPFWDWTVSGAGHRVYYQTRNHGIQSGLVQVPFLSNGHPLNTVVEKDMYPEDGWMLVYRDFGTPSGAPFLPNFALYNRYTGVLRFMAYNAPEYVFSSYQYTARFEDPRYTGASFTLADTANKFLTNYNPEFTQVSENKVTVLNGWFYVDIDMAGYDPAYHPYSELRLEIAGINRVYQINGENTYLLSEDILRLHTYLIRLAIPDDPVDYDNLYYPVQPIPWGIFNIVDLPQITSTHVHSCQATTTRNGILYRALHTQSMPTEPLQYVFNTETGLNLSSVELAYQFDSAQTTFQFQPLTEFNTKLVNSAYGQLPIALRIRAKIVPQTPTKFSFAERTIEYSLPLKSQVEFSSLAQECNNATVGFNAEAEVFPNPAGQQANFTYRVPKNLASTLHVYNAQAQLVGTIQASSADEAGYHQLSWNLQDQYGQRVAPGSYIYRIQIGQEMKSGVFIVN